MLFCGMPDEKPMLLIFLGTQLANRPIVVILWVIMKILYAGPVMVFYSFRKIVVKGLIKLAGVVPAMVDWHVHCQLTLAVKMLVTDVAAEDIGS